MPSRYLAPQTSLLLPKELLATYTTFEGGSIRTDLPLLPCTIQEARPDQAAPSI
jgi:hypothetical protein